MHHPTQHLPFQYGRASGAPFRLVPLPPFEPLSASDGFDLPRPPRGLPPCGSSYLKGTIREILARLIQQSYTGTTGLFLPKHVLAFVIDAAFHEYSGQYCADLRAPSPYTEHDIDEIVRFAVRYRAIPVLSNTSILLRFDVLLDRLMVPDLDAEQISTRLAQTLADVAADLSEDLGEGVYVRACPLPKSLLPAATREA